MSQDTVQEARQLIEEMRNRRAELGDSTRLTPKRIHYKRMTRSVMADGALFVYTFVSGMLFGAVMQGLVAAIACFIVVIVAMLWTYLKE